MKRTIAVAGTIGAGKTSLVKWLVERFGLVPFFEPNDENPYLADFYADMPRWAFQSQVFFLAHKLKLHQEHEASPVPAVIDRTIYEDAEIFAKNLRDTGTLSARDWAVYGTLYRHIKAQIRPPDLLIALTCDLRTTKKRIADRGRTMEKSIPDAYLRSLHKLYDDWFSSYDIGPILRIDTSKLDYVENLLDRLDLEDRLSAALR